MNILLNQYTRYFYLLETELFQYSVILDKIYAKKSEFISFDQTV